MKRWSKKRKWMIGLIAGLSIILAVLLVFFLSSNKPAQETIDEETSGKVEYRPQKRRFEKKSNEATVTVDK